MMDNGNSLPAACPVAEAVPTYRKRNRNDRKRISDKKRSKTRVNIGVAFKKWRELRDELGLRKDADLACVLVDSYLRTKSDNRPEQPTDEWSSSSETSSLNEVEWETCAASSVQSSHNGKESGKKDVARQRLKSQDERTTNQSGNKENRDIQEDEDGEFSTSISVRDGRYLVDLGSSSEFIVDEECILQLFKSCRECNRRCTVRKRVKGLKLVINQACRFCQSRSKWTNLSDDDDDDFQINGKDAAHVQANSAKQ